MTTENNVVVLYNGKSYTLPAGTTGPQALEVMKQLRGELKNGGSFTENEDGSVSVFCAAQKKSADVVVLYNGKSYTLPDGTSGPQALEVMKQLRGELKNGGSFTENEDGSISVFCAAQKKSWFDDVVAETPVAVAPTNDVKVLYNGKSYTLPAGTTAPQALEVMKQLRGELKNGGSFTENSDGSISVFCAAQKKSADVVVLYNGKSYTLPEGTSGPQALEVMKQLRGELKNGGSFTENEDGSISVFCAAQKKSTQE